MLPLASRAGCCGPAAWRGAAARGAGWHAGPCGCCPWWLLRLRFSTAAGPRLVIVPAAVAWRGRRLRFAIISPGSSSSSSVLVPVPATSMRGFFCSRWRLVGGDGSIFVEFGTPDFSLLPRHVLRCRRRVCEFLHRSFSGLLVVFLSVDASHAWSHKGIATCPSSTDLSGDLKKDAVLVCVGVSLFSSCVGCVVLLSMHVRTDTTSAYIQMRGFKKKG